MAGLHGVFNAVSGSSYAFVMRGSSAEIIVLPSLTVFSLLPRDAAGEMPLGSGPALEEDDHAHSAHDPVPARPHHGCVDRPQGTPSARRIPRPCPRARS